MLKLFALLATYYVLAVMDAALLRDIDKMAVWQHIVRRVLRRVASDLAQAPTLLPYVLDALRYFFVVAAAGLAMLTPMLDQLEPHPPVVLGPLLPKLAQFLGYLAAAFSMCVVFCNFETSDHYYYLCKIEGVCVDGCY